MVVIRYSTFKIKKGVCDICGKEREHLYVLSNEKDVNFKYCGKCKEMLVKLINVTQVEGCSCEGIIAYK